MKNNPKVSIIIPVYNGEKYVKSAIQSALKQTYKNIEIIVVNDGSTDNTDKVVQQFKNKIIYLKKENGGVSSALNLGLLYMTGDYFSWLSHDDIYKKNKIEEEISFLRSLDNDNENVILYSDYCFITANGRKFGNEIKIPHEDVEKHHELALLKGYLNGITMLIPRKAFEQYGNFDENLRCTQDYDKWLQFYDSYYFKHIPKVLAYTRLHAEQTTNTSEKMIVEGNELWKKIVDTFANKAVDIFGSKEEYYREMITFLKNSQYKEAMNYCQIMLNKEHSMNVLSIDDINIVDLQKDISLLKDEIAAIKKKNYISEKSLFDSYKVLEYKLWEFNTNCNKILYQMSFINKVKDNNFHPLVSIIIPAYNASDYLEQAIQCALNQTYDNVEIIIVNDGSTDGGKTKQIAMKYKNKVSYFEKKNGGVSSALNFGIDNMKGEYFAWLSHDDLIAPNHIEIMINYLSYHTNEDVIPYVAFNMCDKDGNLLLNQTVIAQLYYFDYKISIVKNLYTLLQGEINGGSVLIPKKAFKEFGKFNEDLRISQERDMWRRLIRKYKFICIPYDTATIRVHDKQVTANNDVREETNRKNLEIINEIPENIMKELEGSKKNFYIIMRQFYKKKRNNEMVQEIHKLIEEQ